MSDSEKLASNVQDPRNPLILSALDSIHRSLLLKNMQFEGMDYETHLKYYFTNNHGLLYCLLC